MERENQVGVVVTRCVPQANISRFEHGLRELVRVASSQAGHISAEILRGAMRPEGLSISEITSGLNSRPSQSWTVMVEGMNPELPPVDTWS